MKRTFSYEFENESANTLTYECSPTEDEKLDCRMEEGELALYMNPSAMMTLAKMLVKMSSGTYAGGFHVHIGKDFNPDNRHVLRVVVSSS